MDFGKQTLLVAFVATIIASNTVLAQQCKVEPPETGGKIDVPYVGGCKGGLAEGNGEFSFTVGSPPRVEFYKVKGIFVGGKLNGKATIVVNFGKGTRVGTFSNNQLNGYAKTTGTDGSWDEGTWVNGQRWDQKAVYNDIKRVAVWVKGVQTVGCSTDPKHENYCSDSIRAEFGVIEPAGSKSLASNKSGAGRSGVPTNSRAQTLASKGNGHVGTWLSENKWYLVQVESAGARYKIELTYASSGFKIDGTPMGRTGGWRGEGTYFGKLKDGVIEFSGYCQELVYESKSDKLFAGGGCGDKFNRIR